MPTSSLEDRKEKALGNVTRAAFEKASSLEDKKSLVASFANPWADLMKEVEEQNEALDELSSEDEELLDELVSMFESDDDDAGQKASKKDEVKRAREIIDKIQLNVNFPALPYGDTFLSNAVEHSLGMVKLLIEKGADVNNEDTMEGTTALDKIMEWEEDEEELDDEVKMMKELLLSKGAKTYEERMNQLADDIRGM